METKLYANGLTDLTKFLPPKTNIEIVFEMSRPEFYLTSYDGTEGRFVMEEMTLTAKYVNCVVFFCIQRKNFSYHQLTNDAQTNWYRSAKAFVPHFYFKEAQMGWQVVKAGSTSYRFTIEPLLMTQGMLPEQIILGFSPSKSFIGDYGTLSGIFRGINFLYFIVIKVCFRRFYQIDFNPKARQHCPNYLGRKTCYSSQLFAGGIGDEHLH